MKTEDRWTPYVREPEKSAVTQADAPGGPARPSAAALWRQHVSALTKERDCYKQAEARVRSRLHRLQTAIGLTMEALEDTAGERRREARARH